MAPGGVSLGPPPEVRQGEPLALHLGPERGTGGTAGGQGSDGETGAQSGRVPGPRTEKRGARPEPWRYEGRPLPSVPACLSVCLSLPPDPSLLTFFPERKHAFAGDSELFTSQKENP